MVSRVVARFCAALAIASGAAACDGCRGRGGSADVDAAERGEEGDPDGGTMEAWGDVPEPEGDGGNAATEAGSPRGTPACVGSRVDAVRALDDARCAISAREARRLRAVADDAGAQARFVQRGTAEDDGTITLRVENVGTRTVTVPLLDHPDLPAFTAVAQEPSGVLYELEAPALVRSEGEAGDGGRAAEDGGKRARLARARVGPKGAVVVRLLPGRKIVKRLSPPCPDGGRCAPAELEPGAYVLHLGQLVVDVEAGPPARVAHLFR